MFSFFTSLISKGDVPEGFAAGTAPRPTAETGHTQDGSGAPGAFREVLARLSDRPAGDSAPGSARSEQGETETPDIAELQPEELRRAGLDARDLDGLDPKAFGEILRTLTASNAPESGAVTPQAAALRQVLADHGIAPVMGAERPPPAVEVPRAGRDATPGLVRRDLPATSAAAPESGRGDPAALVARLPEPADDGGPKLNLPQPEAWTSQSRSPRVGAPEGDSPLPPLPASRRASVTAPTELSRDRQEADAVAIRAGTTARAEPAAVPGAGATRLSPPMGPGHPTGRGTPEAGGNEPGSVLAALPDRAVLRTDPGVKPLPRTDTAVGRLDLPPQPVTGSDSQAFVGPAGGLVNAEPPAQGRRGEPQPGVLAPQSGPPLAPVTAATGGLPTAPAPDLPQPRQTAAPAPASARPADPAADPEAKARAEDRAAGTISALQARPQAMAGAAPPARPVTRTNSPPVPPGNAEAPPPDRPSGPNGPAPARAGAAASAAPQSAGAPAAVPRADSQRARALSEPAPLPGDASPRTRPAGGRSTGGAGPEQVQPGRSAADMPTQARAGDPRPEPPRTARVDGAPGQSLSPMTDTRQAQPASRAVGKGMAPVTPMAEPPAAPHGRQAAPEPPTAPDRSGAAPDRRVVAPGPQPARALGRVSMPANPGRLPPGPPSDGENHAAPDRATAQARPSAPTRAAAGDGAPAITRPSAGPGPVLPHVRPPATVPPAEPARAIPPAGATPITPVAAPPGLAAAPGPQPSAGRPALAASPASIGGPVLSTRMAGATLPGQALMTEPAPQAPVAAPSGATGPTGAAHAPGAAHAAGAAHAPGAAHAAGAAPTGPDVSPLADASRPAMAPASERGGPTGASTFDRARPAAPSSEAAPARSDPISAAPALSGAASHRAAPTAPRDVVDRPRTPDTGPVSGERRAATPAGAAAPAPARAAGPAETGTARALSAEDASPLPVETRLRADPAAPARAAAPAPAHTAAAESGAGPVRQISAAVQGSADRSFEILLSPAELGKVRISLTPSEGALLVSIQADRPETLDLLRRHADMLAQDFRNIGYGSAEFSFGQGERGRGFAAPVSGSGDAPANDPAEPGGTSARQTGAPFPVASPSDRIDIRL